MASTFATRLSDGDTLILDGGLSNALESHGKDLNNSLWSAKLLKSDPDAIKTVHLDYFRAGADVAITASYQGSVKGLTEHLSIIEGEAKGIIRESVRLAVLAREEARAAGIERELFVAGSVGPYGAYLANGAEYTGLYDVTEKELVGFHRGRIEALLQAGADVLACETIPNVHEVRALCTLLKNEFPSARAWLSFTLRDAAHISDGTPVEEVVKLVEECDQIVAVGFNCIPLDLALQALEHIKPLTSKPLVIYPNSGEQWDASKKAWYGGGAAAAQLKDLAKQWHSAGARLIGGCCRMGPDDIQIIQRALKS